MPLLHSRDVVPELLYVPAEAALQLEESRLVRLESQPRAEDIPPLEARVRSAEVEAQRTQGTFERVKAARAAGAASMEDLEQRRFAVLAAQAAL